MKKTFAAFVIFFLILVFGLNAVMAETAQNGKPAVSLGNFKKIPILDQGRVKPLETYAENVLLQFSGRRSYNKLDATTWLAKLLFDSDSIKDDKVFLINNPEVALAIGIVPEVKRRYSFSQIQVGYHKLGMLVIQASQIEDKKRTIVENELLRLYENVHLYLDLSQAFQFAYINPDFEISNPAVKKHLALPDNQQQFSFIDIALKANQLHNVTDGLEKKSVAEWSAFEKDIFRLLANLYQWSLYYRDMAFHIVAPLSSTSEEWLSPWDAIAKGFQGGGVRHELILLQDMARAYLERDQSDFDNAIQGYLQSMNSRTGTKRAIKVIPLELVYNAIRPFSLAQMFYAFALILTFISVFNSRRFFYGLAFGAVIAGFLPHVWGIIARIIILHRPPVSSLYETFIYVSFLTVLIGIIVELSNRQRLGMLVSSICGVALLMIAGKFSAEGDTMKMLVAVLNSNFWLTIHVLHITAGYATCCAAGVLGHVYLVQAIIQPKGQAALEKTFRYVFIVLGFGLTLTVFGTAMGGIWADQSWGRFWGWDPKENGALLIILWCAIIFHMRIARLIGPLGFVVGSALVISVVMWAWFGVNFLGVGLHSYGFTQGIAKNLIIYYVCEVIFIVVAVVLIRIKNRHFGSPTKNYLI